MNERLKNSEIREEKVYPAEEVKQVLNPLQANSV